MAGGASGAPFEISLGPLPSGRVGAVLARCADGVGHRRCSLSALSVESASPSEARLGVSIVGSVFRPALWGNRLAFLLATPDGGEREPVRLFEWKIGSSHATPLTLPRNSYYRKEVDGAPVEETAEPTVRDTGPDIGRITALSLRGIEVAYVRLAPWGEWTRSDLWYRQFRELGQAWVRYSLTGNEKQRGDLDFDDDPEGLVQSAVPFGAGVIWTLGGGSEPDGRPMSGHESSPLRAWAGARCAETPRPTASSVLAVAHAKFWSAPLLAACSTMGAAGFEPATSRV